MTVVLSVRRRLSAIAIVVAMLLSVAAPMFAAESAHQACLAKQHDCGDTAQLEACCCLEQGGRSDEATPATGRAEVAQPVADASTAARC